MFICTKTKKIMSAGQPTGGLLHCRHIQAFLDMKRVTAVKDIGRAACINPIFVNFTFSQKPGMKPFPGGNHRQHPDIQGKIQVHLRKKILKEQHRLRLRTRQRQSLQIKKTWNLPATSSTSI